MGKNKRLNRITIALTIFLFTLNSCSLDYQIRKQMPKGNSYDANCISLAIEKYCDDEKQELPKRIKKIYGLSQNRIVIEVKSNSLVFGKLVVDTNCDWVKVYSKDFHQAVE